jgi:hypothetical protein
MTQQRQADEKEKSRADLEEEAFFALVDESNFTLPFQFRNWKAHFKTQESFLMEATRWLKAEYEGTPKRVVTDVAMGRGCYNSELIKSGRVTAEDRRLYERGQIDDPYHWMDYGDDCEWVNPSAQQRQWTPGEGYSKGGYTNYWKQAELFRTKLPQTPVIEAPSGLSGKSLVVL